MPGYRLRPGRRAQEQGKVAVGLLLEITGSLRGREVESAIPADCSGRVEGDDVDRGAAEGHGAEAESARSDADRGEGHVVERLGQLAPGEAHAVGLDSAARAERLHDSAISDAIPETEHGDRGLPTREAHARRRIRRTRPREQDSRRIGVLRYHGDVCRQDVGRVGAGGHRGDVDLVHRGRGSGKVVAVVETSGADDGGQQRGGKGAPAGRLKQRSSPDPGRRPSVRRAIHLLHEHASVPGARVCRRSHAAGRRHVRRHDRSRGAG